MSEIQAEAPVDVVPFDARPYPDARRHALAVVTTVVECICGATFDGFTHESAWGDFESHMTEHDVGVVTDGDEL